MSLGRHTRFERRPRARAARGCAAAATALLAGSAVLSAVTAARAAASPPGVAAPTVNDSPPVVAAPAAIAPPGDASPGDASPAEDIRDIRGPKSIFPTWLAIAWAIGAVLLALAGYAAWRWKRRQRRPRKLLPFEIMLQRLEALRPLMEPATVREFSIAISDIVRGHIEQSFDVTATHRTTEEFLRDLVDSKNSGLASHRNLLAEFLYRCDVAKFAGVTLSPQIIESLFQSARTFVIETSKAAPADPTHPSHDSLPAT